MRTPATPPTHRSPCVRSAASGNPGLASDTAIITASDGVRPGAAVAGVPAGAGIAHNTAHGYIGGDIGAQHQAFEDPFVFLLHSNVDRLFAMWQTQPGEDWRLDPGQVYGDQAGTTGDGGILQTLQPWDGTVVFGSPIEPWVGSSPQIEVKNCKHPRSWTPAATTPCR